MALQSINEIEADYEPIWLPNLPSDRPMCREDCLSYAIQTSDAHALVLLPCGVLWVSEALASSNTDSRGLAPLHVAVLFKRHQTLYFLLSNNVVDINQPSTNAAKKGWTALHFAAFLMDLTAIKLLIQFKYDPSLTTNLGSTPLHFVTGRFNNCGDHLQDHVYTVIRTLINAGVDPGTTNSYGYTVMHESIMWNDVLSLGVILDQTSTTTQYFEKLHVIGGNMLPYELGWNSALPVIYKKTLERNYFALKKIKESTGVTTKVIAHDFHIYEIFECVSNPSPTTVVRKNFLHPESMTASEVGTLVQSAETAFVVEALKHQQAIHKYLHYTSGETRYMFPAYLSQTLPKWVCTDCCKCRIVAGRWLEMVTAKTASCFLLHLMMSLLSKVSFSNSTTVASNAAYFSTATKVQLGIQCIDHIHSAGVLIQVCSYQSSSPETVTECRSLLNFVIDVAYELKPDIGPVAVVSSRDLRAGKKIPYLFSCSEVNQARASHKSFLSNPARLHVAETFADLLLSEPQLSVDADECDSVPKIKVQTQKTYYQSDVWEFNVYLRTIRNHEDDIAKLLNAAVVADCLVLEGVISSSERDSVLLADDKISYLLEMVHEKNAYCNCFEILLQTGKQLPAHGRLWDILNETCIVIDHSGSLNNFYLDSHTVPLLSPIPEHDTTCCGRNTSTTTAPVSTTRNGRITEESGYGTQNSAQSQNLTRQLSPSPGNSFIGSPSFSRQQTANSLQDIPLLATKTEQIVSSVYECKTTTTFGCDHHFLDKDCSPVLPVPQLSRSNSFSSSPINIPRRNSKSSTRPQQSAGVTEITISSSPKHLDPSNAKCMTTFWCRIIGAVLYAMKPTTENDGGTDTFKVLPGIKPMF